MHGLRRRTRGAKNAEPHGAQLRPGRGRSAHYDRAPDDLRPGRRPADRAVLRCRARHPAAERGGDHQLPAVAPALSSLLQTAFVDVPRGLFSIG